MTDSTFSADETEFGTISEADQPSREQASSAPLPHIPGYQLLRCLGRGGMGQVFLAEHMALGRQVAVKIVAAGATASPDMLSRFRAESRAVASVKHAGICQIFEAGQCDASPFLAMEYIEGKTLSEAIRHQLPTFTQAAKYIQEIARAIEACHQAGILHRDLKPSNVMLSQDNSVKIMDFGLAKQLSQSDVIRTRTGEILGTPSYMAPEQASGVVKSLGPECDVYGIGAILYELLTGRPPFQTPDVMQTILLVLTADPIRPRALQPKVPADLETICLKCLQKQPKKRYATAALLLEDVERFLAHCPIQARPSSMLERSVKWARRHPSASAWIATGAFAVVATLAGAWFHIDRLETELDRNGRLVSQSQEWGNWLVNVHIPEVAKLGGGNELQAQLVGKTLEHLRQLELDVSADRQLGEYIAQAYVHISEVQSDPAFATPERIEQALESYSRAASLYQELAANSTDSHLRLVQAKIFSAMSRLYISVNRAAEAEACIKQAFSQLQALDEQESVAIPELRLAHLRAQEQRLALTLPNLPPAEALEQLLQLYHACKALPLGIDDGGRHELIALCALQIAQLNPSSMGLDNASDDSPHTSTRFYQEAIDELRTLSVVDKRRERDLVIALDSLGRTYEQELEYDRAENVLRQAVDVQMRLINENPDSTNFQEQLLRLLERQFRVAQSARDFEQALTVAEEFVVRAEKIILTDPTRFRAEKRQAYTMCGVANRGLSRDDRAYECLERAEEVARSLASQSDAQEDWEELAKVLLQKSEVLVKRDQGRSIIVQQVRSLELAIHWLYEAMAIFERISQGTTSESESPYWQAVEAKNLMESELKNLKLRSRESTRPFQGGIDQE